MRHPDEGEIHAWLDGALDAAAAAGVEAHVAACPACAAAVAEARGLIAGASRILMALDGVPSGVIPTAQPEPIAADDDLGARRRQQESSVAASRRVPWYARRPVRIAAGLMLVAGVGGLVVRNSNRSGTVSVQFETGMPAPVAAPATDLGGVATSTGSAGAELPPAQRSSATASAPSRGANDSARRAVDLAELPAAVPDAFGGERSEKSLADRAAVRRTPEPVAAPTPAPPPPSVVPAAPGALRLGAPLPVANAVASLADSMLTDRLRRMEAPATVAQGQGVLAGTMGTIAGKVVAMDSTPLGLVSVTVTSVDAAQIARAATTRADGTFELPPVPPGRYTVEARRIGYEPARRERLEVASGDTAYASLALKASALRLESVVVAGAGGVPKVGSACFTLDVNPAAGGAGMPLLPRRVRVRLEELPTAAGVDAVAARADRPAIAQSETQRRAFTSAASEPALPLAWHAVAGDSIEAFWPLDNETVTLRLGLRGSSVRGTAVSSSGTPPWTATVSGLKVNCGGRQ
jgi:anti-sigma factor RsiW